MKTKTCLYCMSKIGRVRYPGGRLRSLKLFKKQKFCSTECSNKWHSGSRSATWKGGVSLVNGYLIDTKTGEPIHRLVMEKHLCRKLKPFPYEVVHHRDGDKLNNSIANLELLSLKQHSWHHWKEKKQTENSFVENRRFEAWLKKHWKAYSQQQSLL